ncbi:MAG TPA: DUF1361 domain-containing protein [Beutenbergiaceae bacterium]|nr:DUF1361 domain-containing protein [Beutenbergiaceae bacterium]
MTLFLPTLVGVGLLNLYALALVLLRAPLFSTRLYRPMTWNIWLSSVPAVILVATLGGLFLAVHLASTLLLWIVITVGGLMWLLALPNAAYLITELNFSHRQAGENVPMWYDIVLVLTLALSGVANTLLNILLAHVIISLIAYPNDPHPLVNPTTWVGIGVVLLLVGFGVYLGRYVRFNSWDIKRPIQFLRKLRGHFESRANRRAALGLTLTHALLLGILYLLLAGPQIIYLM